MRIARQGFAGTRIAALAAILTLALPALPARAVVTVGAGPAGRTVPPGFLGLSLE